MAPNAQAIRLTKIVCGASFIILSVGIFFIPSTEEKIRKMQDRIARMDEEFENNRNKHHTISGDFKQWQALKDNTMRRKEP